MICGECGKNAASVHFIATVNGVRREYNICMECAKKMGLGSYMPLSLGDFFVHTQTHIPAQLNCTVCGMTISELKKKGLAGCEYCYHDLKAGMEPILWNVQRSLTHSGRTPIGFESAMLHSSESQQKAQSLEEQKTQDKEHELRIKLQIAVASENFEEAALIRDQIKELKGEDAQ